MKWLLITLILILLTAALPLSLRAQSYISDDMGLSWYPDYDDDELLPWYEGIREGVLAQRYPSRGRIPTSPSYDDDLDPELIGTSPGYIDRNEVGRSVARGDAYATDDYGTYDPDFNWTTADREFDEWAAGSEDAFRSPTD